MFRCHLDVELFFIHKPLTVTNQRAVVSACQPRRVIDIERVMHLKTPLQHDVRLQTRLTRCRLRFQERCKSHTRLGSTKCYIQPQISTSNSVPNRTSATHYDYLAKPEQFMRTSAKTNNVWIHTEPYRIAPNLSAEARS